MHAILLALLSGHAMASASLGSDSEYRLSAVRQFFEVNGGSQLKTCDLNLGKHSMQVLVMESITCVVWERQRKLGLETYKECYKMALPRDMFTCDELLATARNLGPSKVQAGGAPGVSYGNALEELYLWDEKGAQSYHISRYRDIRFSGSGVDLHLQRDYQVDMVAFDLRFVCGTDVHTTNNFATQPQIRLSLYLDHKYTTFYSELCQGLYGRMGVFAEALRSIAIKNSMPFTDAIKALRRIPRFLHKAAETRKDDNLALSVSIGMSESLPTVDFDWMYDDGQYWSRAEWYASTNMTLLKSEISAISAAATVSDLIISEGDELDSFLVFSEDEVITAAEWSSDPLEQRFDARGGIIGQFMISSGMVEFHLNCGYEMGYAILKRFNGSSYPKPTEMNELAVDEQCDNLDERLTAHMQHYRWGWLNWL